jgi:large subunit ribosomal protein L25
MLAWRIGPAEFIGREDVTIMEEYTLSAQPRTVSGKQVRQLRQQGLIPAVVYGHRTEPLALQIEERALRQLLQRVGGNQLIKLNVDDGGAPRTVLVREVQREPIKRHLLHVDLYEVVMTEYIRTEIPVVLVGESSVVQRNDGLLQLSTEAVAIECLPGDLIRSIEIDVSQLTEVDQAITVADLSLGDKIQILSNPEETLVRVLPVQEEVIEEAAPAAESQIEVAEHGKPEETEQEGQ